MSSPSPKTLILLNSLLFFLPLLSAQENWRGLPTPDVKHLNQLKASGNACGPTCLLNACQAGNAKWQKAYRAIPGTNDRTRILSLIKKYGYVASSHRKSKLRYGKAYGTNITDLTDIANDMRTSIWQPKLSYQILFKNEKETRQQQLHRIHKLLLKSLKKGYPPTLNVQRTVKRNLRNNKTMWVTVKGHYVLLSGLPEKLAADTTSFPISYIDPWGGVQRRGTIRIPSQSFYLSPDDKSKPGYLYPTPTLIADFPQSRIGKHLVGKNERTAVTLSSALGHF